MGGCARTQIQDILLSHPQQPGFMSSPLPGGRVLTTARLSLSHGACFSLTLSGLEKRSGQASPSACPAMGPNFQPTPLFHPRTLYKDDPLVSIL